VKNYLLPHPHIPGWFMTRISLMKVLKVSEGNSIFGAIVTQELDKSVTSTLGDAIRSMPEHILIGLDFAGIASMETRLWSQIGPQLVERVLSGVYGENKRLIYLIGEQTWLINDLQWSFEHASANGNDGNRAVLVPAASRGYCGVLAPIYSEALALVNEFGEISSFELYNQLQRRYKLAPAHADHCLSYLAQLGLAHRYSTISRPEYSYDLNSRGFALSATEHQILHAERLALKVG
jgi:hypothetical protein